MKKINNRRNNRKKIIIILAVILIAAIGVFAYLEFSGKSNIFLDKSKDMKTSEEKEAKTTSKAPSAQADYSDGDDRQPDNANPKPEATVTDKKGALPTTPPESQWSSSTSGAITVYSPSSNSVVSNGSTLSGKATVPKISFRLIDNISGVISQGELSVVNGNFSGSFNFSTAATTGRLDIFSTRADGVEANNIEIPVRFR